MAGTFDHAPTTWTAGRLREAIKDLSDDEPVLIGVARARATSTATRTVSWSTTNPSSCTGPQPRPRRRAPRWTTRCSRTGPQAYTTCWTRLTRPRTATVASHGAARVRPAAVPDDRPRRLADDRASAPVCGGRRWRGPVHEIQLRVVVDPPKSLADISHARSSPAPGRASACPGLSRSPARANQPPVDSATLVTKEARFAATSV